MTYEASRTSVGFEFGYNISGFNVNPVKFELTPNVAFKKGELVVVTNGKVATADENTASGVLGVMAEAILQADNPVAGLTYGKVYINQGNVYRVSISGQLDKTATGGSATVFTSTSEFNAGLIGALIYVYEGKAKGSIRTVSAADNNDLTVIYPFPEAIDTTSKAIVLGTAASGGAINVAKSGVFASSDGLKLNAGKTPDDGPLVILSVDPENLMANVMVNTTSAIYA